jgi:hypothetical protein
MSVLFGVVFFWLPPVAVFAFWLKGVIDETL